MELIHDRTDAVIASAVELALSRKARRTGLLGRAAMDPGAALVLAPCCAVHTAFMRFPIDVLFMDRTGRAMRVIHGLKPWRAAASPQAYAVVELPAGVLARFEVGAGDRFRLEHRC